jgi:hypothetical protein
VRLLILTIAGMILAGTAVAESLTESDKSAFAAKVTSGCIADLNKRPYQPPFTDQEISNYCECAGSSMADVISKGEYDVIYDKHAPAKLAASVIEKVKCIVVEKSKKHLNLAYPEKFQYEQCWKG